MILVYCGRRGGGRVREKEGCKLGGKHFGFLALQLNTRPLVGLGHVTFPNEAEP